MDRTFELRLIGIDTKNHTVHLGIEKGGSYTDPGTHVWTGFVSYESLMHTLGMLVGTAVTGEECAKITCEAKIGGGR